MAGKEGISNLSRQLDSPFSSELILIRKIKTFSSELIRKIDRQVFKYACHISGSSKQRVTVTYLSKQTPLFPLQYIENVDNFAVKFLGF